ncbi:MAG TPA: winged helix-turn-helix transcriptional regulator [Pseudonocardiaceae bacterium]|jgi:DNA-binding HxlR family transcriptional regulator/putative sterol carrier protein|nr:winged helix-turn-helix transcriptional regulator [Pseudonocardiaceae bacterium]
MSTKRTYHQYCGLASALDVLGERWTLLIIRELLMGPRRYTDLLTDLPGLGTNLLAERLRFLVDHGVIRQSGGGHSGEKRAYELTAKGQLLRPVVLALARWGMDFVGEMSGEDVARPHWGFLAVEAMIQHDKIPVQDEEYEFRVDDEVFHVAVRDQHAEALRGPAASPNMVATTDAATFVRIGSGLLRPLAAMVTGELKLAGDLSSVLRCCELLGLEAGGTAADSRAVAS